MYHLIISPTFNQVMVLHMHMGPYFGMNMVWNPSQIQQSMQPNVQLLNQPGQPLVFGPTQQPVQPTVQIPELGLVQQHGPSTPHTPPQTVATIATSIQPTTPVSGVFVAPISTIPASVKIPQVFVLQSGPTVQTLVQMPTGQAGTSTIATSQTQFIYQPYQGQYQFGPTVQNPVYQYQLYPGYTYQQPQQTQFGLVNPGFPRGCNIPNANIIPGYPRYPPPGTGLITQGFCDPNHQLPDLLSFVLAANAQ